MLTVDHVTTRRRGGELALVKLNDKSRPRALHFAEQFIAIAKAHVGLSRDEFDRANDEVRAAAKERKLALALRKLVEDRCTFDGGDESRATLFRKAVFLLASARRSALADGEEFSRDAVMREASEALGVELLELENGLFADLRSAHRLREVAPVFAGDLVEHFDTAQVQAILLRAVRMTVTVRGASPHAARAVFRWIKFLQLLYRVHEHEGGYRVEIDGPFSMFESVTKYGLKLAMIVPKLSAIPCELEATTRFGKDRSELVFKHIFNAPRSIEKAPLARLSTEAADFVESFRSLESNWRVAPCSDPIHLPGLGLSIPDLVFEHSPSGERVFFEIMGFWSRNAVWQRVELAAGLDRRVLWAVSSRLRVSEEVLEESSSGALYVYKGVMKARAVLDKLESLIKQ